MNIQDTEQLMLLMRRHGVSYFKSTEVELKMEQSGQKPIQEKWWGDEKPEGPKPSPPPQAAPPVESTIPHHVNEVAKLMKLSDEDLVDKLFPDYTQQKPEGS